MLIALGFGNAFAASSQRLLLGAGLISLQSPNETDVEISAEYEYRYAPLVGVGAMANYIFSGTGIAVLGAPDVFFHPTGNEWYINASPITEFGARTVPQYGLRLGTRIPIPLGRVAFVPAFAVDLLNHSTNYIFALGLQF